MSALVLETLDALIAILQPSSSISVSAPNSICDEVRASAESVMANSNCDSNSDDSESESKFQVWIDDDAIDAEIARNGVAYLSHTVDALAWRREPFHYFNADSAELTLRFILVLDALNFCFWPLRGYEYENLGKGLRRTLESDETAFDARNLMAIDEATLSKWLLSEFDGDGDVEIPLISERARLLREVGRVLHFEFAGSALRFVRSARGSAVRLVRVVTERLRGFADHCVCSQTGKQSFFYKRAQIFVGDVYAAFSGTSEGAFADIAELTSFADYRVPQLLRALDILRYSDLLAQTVDAQRRIAAGSRAEILIRSAMICAVERLKRKLNAKSKDHRKFTSIEIDWCLWARGEQLNALNKLKPHHRTLTVYY